MRTPGDGGEQHAARVRGGMLGRLWCCKPAAEPEKEWVAPAADALVPSMAPSAAGFSSPVCIILPSGVWKERWDLIIMLLILYSAATVPVRVCFEADATGNWWVFEVGMSLTFMFDLFLNFNTAYMDSRELRGHWVTDRGKIAQRYLSGWFWIDAPSSVPVELVEYYGLAGNGDEAKGLALLRFLRMFRLIRLLRLLKLEAQISRLEELLDVSFALYASSPSS